MTRRVERGTKAALGDPEECGAARIGRVHDRAQILGPELEARIRPGSNRVGQTEAAMVQDDQPAEPRQAITESGVGR